MNNISGAIKGFAYQTEQSAKSFFVRGKDLRADPEFFEKVCQVAVASLQLLMIRYPSMLSLSQFSFALSTAVLHDFYAFLKQPRQLFFPVSYDLIEENDLLASLTKELQAQLDPSHGNVQDVEDLAKESLKMRLASMRKSNDAYRNVDEFKDVLQRQIQSTPSTMFSLTQVDLTNVNVLLRHVPLGEKLNSVIWTITDIACVAFFMREWKLLNIAKWGERVGQIPCFHWVKEQHFDTWFLGFVCSGFALKLFEATRKLYDEKLTEEERSQARWNVVTSTAELIALGYIYVNRVGQTTINQTGAQWLTIIAKSLGLISIAIRPAHKFFQPKIAPAA